MTGRLFSIGGPTGAGKDTIVSEFLAHHPEYVRIPRSTTRPPRASEVHGVHYNFMDVHAFKNAERDGRIQAIDHFCGHWYGINVEEIATHTSAGENVIGVFGICSRELRHVVGCELTLIYITAPLTLLHERLISRGDPHDQVKVRIQAAASQIATEPQYFDYIICNTQDIAHAISEFTSIVDATIAVGA